MPDRTPEHGDEPTLVHDHRDPLRLKTEVRHIPSGCTSSGDSDLYRPDHDSNFRVNDTLVVVSMHVPVMKSIMKPRPEYFLLQGMDGRREFWWRVGR